MTADQAAFVLDGLGRDAFLFLSEDASTEPFSLKDLRTRLGGHQT